MALPVTPLNLMGHQQFHTSGAASHNRTVETLGPKTSSISIQVCKPRSYALQTLPPTVELNRTHKIRFTGEDLENGAWISDVKEILYRRY